MSGLVCGAPRVMFLPGVSAVRLKQSTSLPRPACLTSVLIYPQLRWVIVCRLADAPSLNSSSNPLQSSCSVGGGSWGRKRRKVGRAERTSEKTTLELSTGHAPPGSFRAAGSQVGRYPDRPEGLQELTLMFPGGSAKAHPGDHARGLTALQPVREADKGAQLWAHSAARNQI